jgi:hypothetical protein
MTVLVPRKQCCHTCTKLSIHEYITVFSKNVTHVDIGVGFTMYLHLLLPYNALVCQTDQSWKETMTVIHFVPYTVYTYWHICQIHHL